MEKDCRKVTEQRQVLSQNSYLIGHNANATVENVTE